MRDGNVPMVKTGDHIIAQAARFIVIRESRRDVTQIRNWIDEMERCCQCNLTVKFFRRSTRPACSTLVKMGMLRYMSAHTIKNKDRNKCTGRKFE